MHVFNMEISKLDKHNYENQPGDVQHLLQQKAFSLFSLSSCIFAVWDPHHFPSSERPWTMAQPSPTENS